jgi:hypothetical protein
LGDVGAVVFGDLALGDPQQHRFSSTRSSDT